jgi:malate dehydrogenase
MSLVAILGAGPLGAATAHRLAQRGRVGSIQLIDAGLDAAKGKALDIEQSAPIDQFNTRISATNDALAAVSATAIVVADELVDGEWIGDRGTALVERLVRAGTRAPLVFAGPGQDALMEVCVKRLGVPSNRIVGAASSAIVGAVRTMAAVELDLADVELAVVGRPPSFTIGWSAATSGGLLVADRIAPHRLLSISQTLPRLWPPGPFATGAATTRIVEGLINGTRRLECATTVVDGDFGVRHSAVMLPLRLGHQRVLSYEMPSLSPQERTALVNSLGTARLL